jgi:hypothetical protein
LDAKDPILKENLIKWKPVIAYLTDLFTKFNEVNLQLQGDNLNLIKTESIIAAFLARINLMKQNIGRREFSQFPNLSQTNCQTIFSSCSFANCFFLDGVSGIYVWPLN